MTRTKQTGKWGAKILKMDDTLFTQRRRVIKALYEAREIIGDESLPRITVRIAEHEDSNKLGICTVGRNYVTFSHEMKDWDETKLRHVVWHELAHAYFNADHDENCPLMGAKCKKQTLDELKQGLKNQAKKAEKSKKKIEIGIRTEEARTEWLKEYKEANESYEIHPLDEERLSGGLR